MQAFTDEKVNDPEVKKLMSRITTTQDSENAGLDARVEVEVKTGKVYSEYSNILNEIPELDVKKNKIGDKFTDLCEPILGNAKTQKLMEAISNLEELKDMNSLIELI